MQLEKLILCDRIFWGFVLETDLTDDYTISLTDHKSSFSGETVQVELMIFLGKSDDKSEFEVIIYKSDKADKYIPNKYYDDVKRYEEYEDYISFFFSDFSSAHTFINLLTYMHPEFKKRPVRPIE